MDILRQTIMHGHIGHEGGSRSLLMSYAVPTVYIVDDDISVRESLEELVKYEGWHPKIFASAESFLAHTREPGPSCLILDVNLPYLSGLDLQKHVAFDQIGIPIIFITGYGDVPMTVQAMKAGAIEFLTKPFHDEVLLAAVRQAIEQSTVGLRDGTEIRVLLKCYKSLSRREQQVMALVVRGLMNKQIGAELGISEITVKTHRGKMMRKMNAGSLAELVNMNTKLTPKSRD